MQNCPQRESGRCAAAAVSGSTNEFQRFGHHPQYTGFVGELSHFVRGEPGDLVRFVAGADGLVGVGDEKEADVVVLMGDVDEAAGRVVAGRNLVHVDVQRQQLAVDRHEIEIADAGFLAGLAECHLFDLRLAVGVASELQPAVELAVMGQQAAASIG